jgi:hypothetical protein
MPHLPSSIFHRKKNCESDSKAVTPAGVPIRFVMVSIHPQLLTFSCSHSTIGDYGIKMVAEPEASEGDVIVELENHVQGSGWATDSIPSAV